MPPFDEYTIAYADRGAVVDRDRLAAAGYGIGPNLVIDGRLAGLWKRRLKRDSVSIELDPLRPLTREEKGWVPAAVEPYARFLGLSPAITERRTDVLASLNNGPTIAVRSGACQRYWCARII